MTDREIYINVEEYVSTNLRNVPFDKGLPYLQKYVWDLGNKIGKTGPEVLETYFEVKSEEMKK